MNSFIRGRALAALLAVAALLFLSDAPAKQQDSQSRDDQTTFKVDVNLVSLYFAVKDHKGMLVPNLNKEDFQVFEDNKPQTIKYFKAETNQPLTLGILIDTSPSQTRVLPMEQQVGASFLRQVLGKNDLAFVISFDVNVDLLQDLTDSNTLLTDALRHTQIGGGGSPVFNPGPVPTARGGGGTHLYDAVYLAGHDILGQQVGRKAMILLTDGEDQGSKLKIADAIEAAHKADTICYVILIADRAYYGGVGMGYSGDHDMRKMCEETGGRMIDVGNNEKKLRDAFEQIANELRSQYSIGYTSTNPALDGSFRKVQIKTKDGYKVQARAGYYAVAKR
jgi:VWFA-related protein